MKENYKIPGLQEKFDGLVQGISSNKCRASNKRLPLINSASLGIHIRISPSLQ